MMVKNYYKLCIL